MRHRASSVLEEKVNDVHEKRMADHSMPTEVIGARKGAVRAVEQT